MGHKILIVDDEPAIVLILKVRLEAEHYQVFTAYNGVDGLKIFQQEKPDLIITDVMMPGMSGYEFFEALRKQGAAGAIVPVIVTSARGSMAQFFDKWAINFFMPKPFDMPVLLLEIKKALLSHSHAQAEGKTAQASGQGDPRTILMAGVSEYEIRKAKEFLEQHHCVVLQGLDEEDTFKIAKKIQPHYILIEFWEDAAKFDTVKLSRVLAGDPNTKQIPYFVFCRPSLSNDAMKNCNPKHLLVFSSAVDFVHKLEALLQSHESPKKSH